MCLKYSFNYYGVKTNLQIAILLILQTINITFFKNPFLAGCCQPPRWIPSVGKVQPAHCQRGPLHRAPTRNQGEVHGPTGWQHQELADVRPQHRD